MNDPITADNLLVRASWPARDYSPDLLRGAACVTMLLALMENKLLEPGNFAVIPWLHRFLAQP